MKTTKLLAIACTALAVAAFNIHSAVAHEGGAPGHTHGQDAKVTIPDSADGILQELKQQNEKLTATVTAKNLKEVHDLSENMTALANALPDKVAADKKQRVQGSVNNLTKLLDNLHHAADDGNHPRTAIEMKKLEGVMMALEKQVK